VHILQPHHRDNARLWALRKCSLPPLQQWVNVNKEQFSRHTFLSFTKTTLVSSGKPSAEVSTVWCGIMPVHAVRYWGAKFKRNYFKCRPSAAILRLQTWVSPSKLFYREPSVRFWSMTSNSWDTLYLNFPPVNEYRKVELTFYISCFNITYYKICPCVFGRFGAIMKINCDCLPNPNYPIGLRK
jgi:hypothetical protein